MDELDHKILKLLSANARISVKEIADRVSLTSPAVSSRIHKLEQSGVIGGYTVSLNRPKGQTGIDAIIGVSAPPGNSEKLMQLMTDRPEVLQCFHVTGDHSFMVRVSCPDMPHLEQLILAFQKLGRTNTQIILSVPLNRNGLDILAQQED